MERLMIRVGRLSIEPRAATAVRWPSRRTTAPLSVRPFRKLSGHLPLANEPSTRKCWI